ncbi:MAG: hypothetical protein WBC88_07875 [Candidatus Zixiibacteriota bacterium]
MSWNSIFRGKITQVFLISVTIFMVCAFLPPPVLAGPEPDGVRSVDRLVERVYQDGKHVLSSP